MHKDLPRLTAPRSEVERYLTIQIEKGKALSTFEASASGVDEIEKRLAAWDLETIRILQDFFDSSDVADEYKINRGAQDDWTEGRKTSTQEDESSGRERPSAIQILNRRMRDTYATSVPAKMKSFEERLRKRIQWLESFRTKRLPFYAQPPLLTISAMPKTTDDAVQILNLICSRFHKVAKQLRKRHKSGGEPRHTLDVGDEYDVQDLLHALLWLSFDDIRREEVTPSHAGGSGRVDFLLRREQIGVETKMGRQNLGDKLLGEQLIIDIARFKGHPNCKTLYCFVYDPEGLIQNPDGIEKDLNREEAGLVVIVNIAPKT